MEKLPSCAKTKVIIKQIIKASLLNYLMASTKIVEGVANHSFSEISLKEFNSVTFLFCTFSKLTNNIHSVEIFCYFLTLSITCKFYFIFSKRFLLFKQNLSKMCVCVGVNKYYLSLTKLYNSKYKTFKY